jgi:hypothetical protein
MQLLRLYLIYIANRPVECKIKKSKAVGRENYFSGIMNEMARGSSHFR